MGGGVVTEALKAGLVDELVLHQVPVLLGGGRPFFQALPEHVRLRLVEAVRSGDAEFATATVCWRVRRKRGPSSAPPLRPADDLADDPYRSDHSEYARRRPVPAELLWQRAGVHRRGVEPQWRERGRAGRITRAACGQRPIGPARLDCLPCWPPVM